MPLPVDLSADRLLFGEFGQLQRLNLAQLQNELANIKGDLFRKEKPTKDEITTLRRTLHEYITAIRDLEYVRSLTRVDEVEGREHQVSLLNVFPETVLRDGAPYSTTYRSFPDPSQQMPDAVREALRKHLHRALAYTSAEKDRRLNQYWHGEPPEIYSPWVDRIARFVIAFVGGAALLVPMIVMIFDPSRTKSVVVTCVSVLLFAAFLAFGINASNQDTLAATATYAAVLVVFIGTSTSSGG